MKLIPLKNNCNMVDTETKKILVSYKTIVAYFDKETRKYFKTSTKWSNTTNRHIKLFFDILAETNHSAFNPVLVEQASLDHLLD